MSAPNLGEYVERALDVEVLPWQRTVLDAASAGRTAELTKYRRVEYTLPRFDFTPTARAFEALGDVVRAAAEEGMRRFQAIGDGLLRAMYPESYRALERARAAAARAERIRRSQVRPLAIDGAAYRRRTRRRRT